MIFIWRLVINPGDLRDAVDGDLVALVVEVLHHLVVAVLVTNEESTAHRALVRVFVDGIIEEIQVVFVVLSIDCAVQRENNHLRRL